jgi:hypothetical protein
MVKDRQSEEAATRRFADTARHNRIQIVLEMGSEEQRWLSRAASMSRRLLFFLQKNIAVSPFKKYKAGSVALFGAWPPSYD